MTVKFLLSYSKKPIHLFGGVGLGLMVASFLVLLWLAIRRVVVGIPVLGSPWFQISVMSFILGFMSILLGLIAELLMRTYYESQNKRTYEIREVIKAAREVAKA